MITILHNNRCSKSREAIQFLEKIDIPFTIRYYLEDPLNEKEINDLLEMLNVPILDLVRTNESLWKDKFSSKTFSRDELISILANHPKLMQRPIVVKDKRAVIARPTEKIDLLLS